MQIARRRALRLKKMNYRYAAEDTNRRAAYTKWLDDRKNADLELVWKSNGLTKEPPILTLEQKKQNLLEWREKGKAYYVMTHEEICDYNIDLPLRVKPSKLQPYVWRSLEDNDIPRHQKHLFGLGHNTRSRSPALKNCFSELLRAQRARRSDYFNDPNFEMPPSWTSNDKHSERQKITRWYFRGHRWSMPVDVAPERN